MAGTAAISRIVGIDLTRSVAIFFAMLSHVWVVTAMDHFWSSLPADLLRALMALATPIFILLFGTMLEIIYRPKFVPGEQGLVAMRLFSRAIQCWLLYCLSVIALYLVPDGYSLKFSIATMMLLGVTPFTDILKFYAVVLFLAPILLLLRNRTGLLPLLRRGRSPCSPPDRSGIAEPYRFSDEHVRGEGSDFFVWYWQRKARRPVDPSRT